MESYQKNNSTMRNIGKGIGISLITTMILLLIFSIILTYTNVSENTITPVIIVITAISILLRKFNRKWKNKKEWTFKWSNSRRRIHTNFVYYIKHIKLEIWT